MSAKFQKTSIQLPPMVLRDMGHWPGLTQSEALRLSVERGHYLSTLNSEEIAGLAEEYEPILAEALEDLDYDDYRLAARSLPAIVAGFLGEDSRIWHYEYGDRRQLQPSELLEKLSSLNAAERIAVLDCIVAERHRREKMTDDAKNSNKAEPPTARDFEREIRERWRLAEAEGASHVDINAGDVHRKIGGYPAANGQHRMATCCQVMNRLKWSQDKNLNQPEKGKGASLEIRYFLPRLANPTRSVIPKELKAGIA